MENIVEIVEWLAWAWPSLEHDQKIKYRSNSHGSSVLHFSAMHVLHTFISHLRCELHDSTISVIGHLSVWSLLVSEKRSVVVICRDYLHMDIGCGMKQDSKHKLKKMNLLIQTFTVTNKQWMP